jgi:hypothetical protein
MKAAMLGLLALAATGAGACAQPILSTKVEDGARRAVPVAICLKPLPRRGTVKAAPILLPEDYWSMILPSFDPSAGTVDLGAPDCSGRPIFTSPELLSSSSTRTGPIRANPADVITGPAPDGFRVVWLRTHSYGDGSVAGPIALVRGRETYGEVYAIGLYHGSRGQSRFALERMGFDLVITAVDDGCAEVKGQKPCQSTMTPYLMSGGELFPATQIVTDRLENGFVPGASGQVQFRLTATPIFQDRAVRVLEQFAVRDPNQGDIRKSELERVFTLRGRTKLVSNAESLWAEVLAAQGAPEKKSTPAASTPSAPKR